MLQSNADDRKEPSARGEGRREVEMYFKNAFTTIDHDYIR